MSEPITKIEKKIVKRENVNTNSIESLKGILYSLIPTFNKFAKTKKISELTEGFKKAVENEEYFEAREFVKKILSAYEPSFWGNNSLEKEEFEIVKQCGEKANNTITELLRIQTLRNSKDNSSEDKLIQEIGYQLGYVFDYKQRILISGTVYSDRQKEQALSYLSEMEKAIKTTLS